MKALISALSQDYEHAHDLDSPATQINRIDQVQTWRFSSNLGQLSLYAGRTRHYTSRNPVTDFMGMANAATDELTDMYDRIRELTGEDPGLSYRTEQAIPPYPNIDKLGKTPSTSSALVVPRAPLYNGPRPARTREQATNSPNRYGGAS